MTGGLVTGTVAGVVGGSVGGVSVVATPVDDAVVPPAAVALDDPVVLDPELVDPELVDPELVDPVLVDPALVDPALVDPALVEPGLVEPELVEVELVDPVVVEPVVLDDPAAADPSTATPMVACDEFEPGSSWAATTANPPAAATAPTPRNVVSCVARRSAASRERGDAMGSVWRRRICSAAECGKETVKYRRPTSGRER